MARYTIEFKAPKHAMSIYAITLSDARSALSAADLAAFEECSEHSVSDEQVDRDFSRFDSRQAAREYLRRNGGGWYLDESGNSHWVETKKITINGVETQTAPPCDGSW